MNNILEMIKNEKVEWKKLWEVTSWDKKFNGVEKNKQQKVDKYHYYLASELKALSSNKGNIKILTTNITDMYANEDDVSKNISCGEIVCIPWGGNPVVQYFNGKFITGDNRIARSIDTNILLNKYLYYFLLENIFLIEKLYRGSGIKHPNMKRVLEIEIPIPSLETQERIVKILDAMVGHFTQLEARNKQYEYYRDKLLSEEYLNKLTNELLQLKISENLNFISLEDLVDVVVGGDVPKHSLSKTKNEVFNIPIYSNGTEEKSLYGYTENARVFDNSITVSARGTIGYVSFKKEPYYPIVRLICLIPKKDNFNLKFLYYFLQQYKFNYVETGIPSLTSDMVKKIKVPLPNIEIQNTIVDFLDRFQAIIQDVDGLLPKEIELRKKQYEYYRERLLDFKRDDDE